MIILLWQILITILYIYLSDYYYKDPLCELVETVVVLLIVVIVLISDYFFRKTLKPVVKLKYLFMGILALVLGAIFNKADLGKVLCFQNSMV